MNRRMVAAAMACVVIGSGLTGCGSSSDAGPPPTAGVHGASSATATSSATPSLSVSETPRPSVSPTLSPTANPSDDALFLEASKVHLRYLEQLVAFEKSGGGDELPPAMAQLVGASYGNAVQKVYARFEKAGLKATEDSTWSRTKVWPIPATGQHLTAIGACVDLRGMTYTKKGTSRTAQGPWRLDELQFDWKESSLIMTEGRTSEVESC